jgi:PhzF family phenazine biosynthesis protein
MLIWLVDAFVDAGLRGNPAAVAICPGGFPAEQRMQRTAAELALPTTAYLVPVTTGRYRVRWFTPRTELAICGHATVASACYLYDVAGVPDAEPLTFETGAGSLRTSRAGGQILIDLPLAPTVAVDPPPGFAAALGVDIVRCERAADDILAEVASPAAVAALRPDFAALARIDCRGHIVTARGGRAGSERVDFVSRTFFPALGVDEDQVCVSAHCKLAPYWAARLGRAELTTVQLSERGGRLSVAVAGERVLVAGHAVARHRLRAAA